MPRLKAKDNIQIGGISVEKPPTDCDILEAEREVLRAMCQGTPERAVLSDGLEILADYCFTDFTHQLVFDTLRELRAGSPQLIRERLPVRLNNKGFPDMDLETFFAPHHLTADEVVARMRTIRKVASGKGRSDAAAP